MVIELEVNVLQAYLTIALLVNLSCWSRYVGSQEHENGSPKERCGALLNMALFSLCWPIVGSWRLILLFVRDLLWVRGVKR